MTDIITSENLLIGAAITNPQTARRLLEELKPEDFTVEANREIFEAMQRIDNRGEDVDPAKAAKRKRRGTLVLLRVDGDRTERERRP